MRHISNEISQRARYLIARDGQPERLVFSGGNYLALWGDVLDMSVDELNVLRIQDALTTETIMVEGPIGTLIETSPDEKLEWCLDYLRQQMILEDLADV